MRWLVPALIIGFVGGVLDEATDLHKAWCFLIGVGVFVFYLFIKSVFITIRVMKETKGAKKIWIDQDNNVIKYE